MLKVQFDGAVLAVRPDGPISREDVGTLTRTADEYLADHPKIAGGRDAGISRLYECGRLR